MPTITIGRRGTQRNPITDPTVSNQHASLTDNGDGTYTLKHLSRTNHTYVNGQEILTCTVTGSDVVRMGNYEVKVADLIPLETPVAPPQPPQPPKQPPVEEVSLTHLEAIWDKYDADLTAIQAFQRSNGLWRSIVPIFTMGGAAITGVAHSMDWPPSIQIVSTILTIVGVLISAYTFYKGYKFDAIAETKKLNQWLQDEYVCPGCGRFMGNVPYRVLKTNSKTCPICRRNYKFTN